ncbi:DUF3465 domain-containing protein [Shewanella inventionis]|uniref:DUF3465 domain-containing protein n=1 Tax=Shewanella inventionis TaxID=1738770 RepID=A0ABQ1JSG1_9GAMM|nr:DUF3465 domain-containing protein [Shewanella inventionis]MCL1159867.1 DUF3465 domain-containing protein [Shewanella inventionis]UAL44564.1 DUF3465 domain-containing protein [Shewanella inventionis]GGB75714.1 hypothetical protein GCM10011607_40000 [Shewanella inventionis]
MKKILLIGLLGIALFGYLDKNAQTTQIVQNVFAADTVASASASTSASHSALQSAIDNRQSNVQVAGSGNVIKVLSDDLKGSRHQRFILKIASGGTLLVAHNIDLAPRINGLNVGDTVEFYGVYEFNNKGGVIHWTHHDPRGQHIGGWLKHNGSTYQ